MFISFEGLDGCGKTTQAAMLAAALELEGRTVVRVREPGGTPIGERIRELLLDGDSVIGGAAEALLYAAARAQLVDQVILPALARGEVVVADRFIDSSLAYQGVARGLGLEQVLQANQLATGGLMPDITLLLELPGRAGGRPPRRQPRPHRVRERRLPRRGGGGLRGRRRAVSRAHPRGGRVRTSPRRPGPRPRGGEPVNAPFEGLPPQSEAQPLLTAALADPGHAYLFSGPAGTGKRRYAEHFAAALLESRLGRIETRAHPDLFVLEAEGGSILIDHARELRRDLHMRPFEADRRVYMILDAHLLRTESANALLKSLEEPPAYAVFVLVSDHAEGMLPTIRSRVVPIPFRRLSSAQLTELTGDAVAARAALGDAGRAQRLASDPGVGRAPLAPTWRWRRASLVDPEFDPGAAAAVITDAASARSAQAQKQIEQEAAPQLERCRGRPSAQGAREADRRSRQAHRPPGPDGGGARRGRYGRAVVPGSDGCGAWRGGHGGKLGPVGRAD